MVYMQHAVWMAKSVRTYKGRVQQIFSNFSAAKAAQGMQMSFKSLVWWWWVGFVILDSQVTPNPN